LLNLFSYDNINQHTYSPFDVRVKNIDILAILNKKALIDGKWVKKNDNIFGLYKALNIYSDRVLLKNINSNNRVTVFVLNRFKTKSLYKLY